MHRSRLPILHPCDQDWSSMSGAGASRHCGACDRDVLDLSAMPALTAIDALIARDGKACIRYRTDAAGEIVFAPPPPPRPGPIAVATLALTACAGWVDEPPVAAPGELGMCVPDGDDPGMCDRPEPDPPPAAKAVTPPLPEPPLPTDREFTAQVELSPSVMGDSAGALPDGLRRGKTSTTYKIDLPRDTPPDDGLRLGMLVIEEEEPTRSLFDRKSRGGPGVDWVRLAELLRMKRQLRREERQRRRAARRG